MGSDRSALIILCTSFVMLYGSSCSDLLRLLQKETVQFLQQTDKPCERICLKASSGMFSLPSLHSIRQRQQFLMCKADACLSMRCCDNKISNVNLIYVLACRAPHIVQVQLGECMKSIVLVDFPEQWPSLLPQLTQNLHSQVRH